MLKITLAKIQPHEESGVAGLLKAEGISDPTTKAKDATQGSTVIWERNKIEREAGIALFETLKNLQLNVSLKSE